MEGGWRADVLRPQSDRSRGRGSAGRSRPKSGVIGDGLDVDVLDIDQSPADLLTVAVEGGVRRVGAHSSSPSLGLAKTAFVAPGGHHLQFQLSPDTMLAPDAALLLEALNGVGVEPGEGGGVVRLSAGCGEDSPATG